jgi:hypothetical protein
MQCRLRAVQIISFIAGVNAEPGIRNLHGEGREIEGLGRTLSHAPDGCVE